MAEPQTEWGKQAVEDIRGLKADVDVLTRNVEAQREEIEALGNSMDKRDEAAADLRIQFVEFRSEIRTLTRVAGTLFVVFGLAAVVGMLGVAFTVARLSVQVETNTEQVRAMRGDLDDLRTAPRTDRGE